MPATKRILILFLLILPGMGGFAQDRFAGIEQQINALKATTPGFTQQVEISVSGANLQEFVRAVAQAHQLNISVSPKVKGTISNNFANATVSDVLLFLCREYDLHIDFVGSILSIVPYQPPPVKPQPPPKRKLGIAYDKTTDFLSLDLKSDSLPEVVKEITKLSFHNVILGQGLENKKVSVFIQNRPFQNTLEKLAYANGLKLSVTDDKFYTLEPDPELMAAAPGKPPKTPKNPGSKHNSAAEITLESGDRITVQARNVPIAEVIKEASDELEKNYFLFSEPEGNTTLYLENATYDEFLSYLLNGTEYTFKKDEEVYLIGQRTLERLRRTELIQLENRTIESVLDMIPQELTAGVEIKEVIELNGFVASGSHLRIEEIKDFIREIDRVVPVVLIDVIIVEVNKNNTVSTGITAALGDGNAPTRSTGGFNTPDIPGGGVTLSSNTLNNLLSRITTGGVINLGNLAPDFYLNLSMLEENGFLKRRSTPKLATLNGHEANLSIGEQEYYLVLNNNIIGTQNPTISESQNYEDNNADLTIKIKPFVSGDEQVTLDIDFQQSDFTTQVGDTGPRGTQSRKFKSIVRLRNGETILLGGLEEKLDNTTGSGLPWLSRIPVIKWFFGSHNKVHNRNQINIFIKPTVIY